MIIPNSYAFFSPVLHTMYSRYSALGVLDIFVHFQFTMNARNFQSVYETDTARKDRKLWRVILFLNYFRTPLTSFIRIEPLPDQTNSRWLNPLIWTWAPIVWKITSGGEEPVNSIIVWTGLSQVYRIPKIMITLYNHLTTFILTFISLGSLSKRKCSNFAW